MHWHNHQRLHTYLGDIPPAEFEAAYAARRPDHQTVGNQKTDPPGIPGRFIVLVRLRYCDRTRSYMERRVAEGKTKKEAIRCLKRFVARELYRTLRADLATLTTRT